MRAGMFDNLSQRLDKAWDLVRKDGKLTSDNIKEPMREIRRALLEADVRSTSPRTSLQALPSRVDGNYPLTDSRAIKPCCKGTL